ncbi:MAG: isoamylase [Nocardioidaceae bacterium]|nr:isoamylase [Nocardioidaceae bacterium]
MSPARPAVIWPGHHRQRGACHDGRGTNFAVWAPEATAVWLCLFDDVGRETRLRLPELTLGVWHGYVPGVGPGQHYGFRADGPWDPEGGDLFSMDKLLLDPYARAIEGTVTPDPSLATITGHGEVNPGDSAPFVPRSVVVGDDDFEWGDDKRPDTPWRDTVIYETHVKGLTAMARDVPAAARGTFAGMAHERTLTYLTDLGVTAVELLPCQHFVSEPAVVAKGLVNYWGYNTIGFFAPHAAYSSSGTRGEQVREFKQMVKNLHAAGLEVIMDVVYNHTAEGERDGPTLCFRGLADGDYYLNDGRGGYLDVTGCGDTVNVSGRQVLQLVTDSMRYWVTEMHVDGFRVDLASAMCRHGNVIDLNAPFLTAVHQDPVLREVKLIAEPWDATSSGYLVGMFPPPWCEWNDKFRDTVRDFWRGRAGGVRELASRLSGSSDLYADDDRLPFASINFITAHDGFTLRDLVTYDTKHNEANGEGNRDGTDDNRSWNCGAEGETADPAVLALRHRQAANLLATLLLSTGVPMLTSGDERGRSQRGNNNAFCLDGPVSWVSWEQPEAWSHLHDMTRLLLRLRAEHPVLRQRFFFAGRPLLDGGRKDISWLTPGGNEMGPDDWADSGARTLGVFLAGDSLRGQDAEGEPMKDTSYVMWLHSGEEPVDVTLPKEWAGHYIEVFRTDSAADPAPLEPGASVSLLDHTFALYEAVTTT